jgi:hypothetical protein
LVAPTADLVACGRGVTRLTGGRDARSFGFECALRVKETTTGEGDRLQWLP